MSPDYRAIARALTEAVPTRLAPIAISLVDEVPPGIPPFSGRVPAGCRFWEEAARGAFATSPGDHDLCAIGTFTHHLEVTPAHESERRDALSVFAELGYVRPEDIPHIPVLRTSPRHVVYAPLAETPLPPDVVLLFVGAAAALILSEASQALEQGFPPAMGRPACALVPQVKNTGRSALSLGCCGARAYLDVLAEDVALYAIPGARLEDYVERVRRLAAANNTLGRFHELRRDDVEGGQAPTVRESLAALQGRR